jgi:hypothetical protein
VTPENGIAQLDFKNAYIISNTWAPFIANFPIVRLLIFLNLQGFGLVINSFIENILIWIFLKKPHVGWVERLLDRKILQPAQ